MNSRNLKIEPEQTSTRDRSVRLWLSPVSVSNINNTEKSLEFYVLGKLVKYKDDKTTKN